MPCVGAIALTRMPYLPQVQAQSPNQAVHPRLRGRVHRNAVVRHERGGGRGRQDDTAAVGPKGGNRSLGGVENTGEVDADHVLPVGIGQILEFDLLTPGDRGHATAGDHTGVGEGDIELAEGGDRRRDGVDHLLFPAHIRGHCDGVAAVLLDQFHGSLGALGVDVDHRHLCAFGSEELSTLASQAGPRSGDEGDLVLEASHDGPFPFWFVSDVWTEVVGRVWPPSCGRRGRGGRQAWGEGVRTGALCGTCHELEEPWHGQSTDDKYRLTYYVTGRNVSHREAGRAGWLSRAPSLP